MPLCKGLCACSQSARVRDVRDRSTDAKPWWRSGAYAVEKGGNHHALWTLEEKPSGCISRHARVPAAAVTWLRLRSPEEARDGPCGASGIQVEAGRWRSCARPRRGRSTAAVGLSCACATYVWARVMVLRGQGVVLDDGGLQIKEKGGGFGSTGAQRRRARWHLAGGNL